MARKYRMRISRLTIDKLGIKLYDKVSAVLAELIANAYDADAEQVAIGLPLDTLLAKVSAGELEDMGYEIKINDDGHGMAEQEVNNFYLKVGIDRRTRGEVTPGKKRRVIGRKGIGKLAPFGICREIEVITAGGRAGEDGYVVSNLILRLDEILNDSEDDYYPTPGPLDGTRAASTGTTVVLRKFEHRRVPSGESLNRQLAARFGLQRSDWRVKVTNTIGKSTSFMLGSLPIEILEGTKIILDTRPVSLDGDLLAVSGWVAYAKDPYKDEAMAGIRIFARGKLVAQTRDFGIESGFTGEFKMRSYLVGEIHAEWLDDEREDLIRSDRQDIIWNSDKGDALRRWGQQVIRDVAKSSEPSITARVWTLFLEVSELDGRLKRVAPDDVNFRESVKGAARLLIGRNDRESLQDEGYVQRVVDLAFAIGPQKDLLEALHVVASGSSSTLEIVVGLFKKARVAETYSLGQVAQERVDAVEQLKRLIESHSTLERDLQLLIEEAPWLVRPDWTPLSTNQTLVRVRNSFETWYLKKYRRSIATSAIHNPETKPDFILLNNEGVLEIIEIKRPGHALEDAEMRRAYQYLQDVRQFIKENGEVAAVFPSARLTIVCDQRRFHDPLALGTLNDEGVRLRTWIDILDGTMRAHEDFLLVVRKMQGTVGEPTLA